MPWLAGLSVCRLVQREGKYICAAAGARRTSIKRERRKGDEGGDRKQRQGRGEKTQTADKERPEYFPGVGHAVHAQLLLGNQPVPGERRA